MNEDGVWQAHAPECQLLEGSQPTRQTMEEVAWHLTPNSRVVESLKRRPMTRITVRNYCTVQYSTVPDQITHIQHEAKRVYERLM
jgi:hypothetical protein